MKKTNIILTGLPGSGKSTIGVILAKELCKDFIDTDVIIQSSEKTTLQQIIDTRGLEEFLTVEENHICALEVEDTVIAPGGSVIFSEEAMNHLKKNGVAVFLDLPLDIIAGRIDIYTRGIVKEPWESLDDVRRKREPMYLKWADIVIECGHLNQLEIMKLITDRLKELSL